MSIGIHAATGKKIGLGHLKRCLSIAIELRRLSYEVEFIVDNELHSELIHNYGFGIKKRINVGHSYEMLIVDKYGLSEPSLDIYKKKCKLLVRIDDAAPTVIRDRVSDIIINGNPYASTVLYNGLIKKDCHLLVGRNFIPMDRIFCQFRRTYRVRRGIRNIAITFGSSIRGGNYAFLIGKAVMQSSLGVNILILNGEKFRNKFDQLDERQRLEILPFTNDIGSIVANTDIVVCSASTTCWQLAAMGIPFIVFQTADNQRLAFEYIQRTKIGMALDIDSIRSGELASEIARLHRSKRELYSKRSKKYIGCKGAKKIAIELCNLTR